MVAMHDDRHQRRPVGDEPAGQPEEAEASGSGVLVRIMDDARGQKKPFQVPWNWRIATAARAGPASGSMTRQNVVKNPAPSIRAASSRSLGIDRKYWRSRKMLVAEIARTRMTADVLEDAPRQARASLKIT